MSISAPPAVLRKRSVTPHSLRRLPNINIPIKGALEGMAREATIPVMIGKRIVAVLRDGDRLRHVDGALLFARQQPRIGGWMIGTRDM